jgi:hypothetical protein
MYLNMKDIIFKFTTGLLLVVKGLNALSQNIL